MYNISIKYKRFWFLVIKLSIIVGAGYFIYQHTFFNKQLPITLLLEQVRTFLLKTAWIIPALIGMSALNWILEIYKWKTLVGSFQNISFYEASKQSLGSHTLALITPFKLGEYGGKSLYYPSYHRNKIWVLSLAGNIAQMLITVLFGIIGFVYFVRTYDMEIHVHRLRRIAYIIAASFLFLFAGTQSGRGNKKGSYYKRLVKFTKKQPRERIVTVFFLSLLRYIVFSHQFYFLLLVFGLEIPYQTAMIVIFTMYFLAMLLPTLSLFDFVIKGSVAVYLFSFLELNTTYIFSITTLMWLLNFALPALVGGIFVLGFKPVKPKQKG